MNESEIIRFTRWTTKMNFRPNTVAAYLQCLKGLLEIDLVRMDNETIIGTLNARLADKPSRVAQAAFKCYIEFLYDSMDRHDPVLYARMRMKTTVIIDNIKLPKMPKKDREDIGKYYIPKDKLMNSLTKLPWNYAYIITLLYDSAARVNELLLNRWENIDSNGILIPARLCKTRKSRNVEWIMPECRKIVELMKGKPNELVQNTFNTYYHDFWYNVQRCLKDKGFNPHSLRHTALTDLGGAGWELGKLAERAGHDDVNRTKQYIKYPRDHKTQTLAAYLKRNNIDLMKVIQRKD